MPIVTLYSILDGGRQPARASRSALGSLPVTALRYCEAVTSASAFGWHVFPPVGFRLTWDGDGISWGFDDGADDDWFELDAVQYPGAMDRWDMTAPEDCRGCCPPWLLRGQTRGLVQVWTGLLISTMPGWSLLVRAPANLPRPWGMEVLEGIVETDRWTGPLFANIRLISTETSFRFPAHQPLFQIVPTHRSAYSDAVLDDISISSLGAMSAAHWSGYRYTIVENARRPLGSYAVEVRKRRREDQ